MWLQYVNIAVVVLLAGVGVYVFVVLSGLATRFLGTGTDHTAGSAPGDYASLLRKQRRHGEQRQESGEVSASRPDASSKAA